MEEGRNLTASLPGVVALVIFTAAYLLVIFEEKLHLRKSKPVLVAAGLIWTLLALSLIGRGQPDLAHEAIRESFLEYVEIFLFLLTAMTYINAMEERNVFHALRSWIVGRGLSSRAIFWLTGALSFCLSPLADNLTTALIMGTVVMAVGGGNRAFVSMSCVNIVVAANAGGAFSPFGDITTLMVWQKGKVQFIEFFAIFLPSVVNWLVPAAIMNFFIRNDPPQAEKGAAGLKPGAKRIALLFLATIATAISFHNFLHLPPAAGMMLGLGYLGIFSAFLRRQGTLFQEHDNFLGSRDSAFPRPKEIPVEHFDMMRSVSRAEWDTLLFFYGVILCVGGLAQFGYLSLLSNWLYADIGATGAHVLLGGLSAVVDNIPIMLAVLTMDPSMAHGQWLLITLTVGVGGSMLSIGSAAGVALMGTARGIYTFGAHLRWLPAIALGYFASILCHLWINAHHF
jgi:NhaD family Na+/H+ antiporter